MQTVYSTAVSSKFVDPTPSRGSHKAASKALTCPQQVRDCAAASAALFWLRCLIALPCARCARCGDCVVPTIFDVGWPCVCRCPLMPLMCQAHKGSRGTSPFVVVLLLLLSSSSLMSEQPTHKLPYLHIFHHFDANTLDGRQQVSWREDYNPPQGLLHDLYKRVC